MDIEVKFGGDEVPKSPFYVNVYPALKLDKVKVKGLEGSEFLLISTV